MANSILIVDDDAELRALYRLILEREGYAVDEATNGAEALKYLMSHTPDVIIMDMLMPMLGGEAFKESAQFLQADQFLVKPVTPKTLVEVIRAVLTGEPFPED